MEQLNQLKPMDVVRDAMGFWTHPDVAQYLNEIMGSRESLTHPMVLALLDHFNIDLAIQSVSLSEVDPDANGDWSGYEPIAPTSNHFLISTVESENSDDAYLWWAKERVNEIKEPELVYCTTDEAAFDDLEDTLEFIRDTATNPDAIEGWEIDVCEKIAPTHKWFFGAKDIIEDMQNRACDEFSEYADDYLNDVEYSEEKIAELDALISDWFDKNAAKPTFYHAGKTVNTITVSKELFKEHGINLE